MPFTDHNRLDDFLDPLITAATAGDLSVHICSGEPESFADLASYSLASTGVGSTEIIGPVNGSASFDFSLQGSAKEQAIAALESAEYDETGRKLIFDRQFNVTVNYTGTPSSIALVDASNMRIEHVTPCQGDGVETNDGIMISEWELKIGAPT